MASAVIRINEPLFLTLVVPGAGSHGKTRYNFLLETFQFQQGLYARLHELSEPETQKIEKGDLLIGEL
jgi:hypothetical protein